MVPQVAVGEVLGALRLEQIGVVAVRGREDRPQRMHLGQVRHGPVPAGEGKPQAVAQAEAGVTVQRQAEGAAQQLLLDQLAQGGALGLHGPAGPATKPGQRRPQALATDQEGHGRLGVQGGVAHQVHPARVGAGAALQAAGVDHRHEHQADLLQQLVQAGIPVQAGDQAAHEGQHHAGAYALQAVHAAEEAHRRKPGRRVAQGDAVQRQRAALFTNGDGLGLHLQPGSAAGDQAFEFLQLG